MKSNDLLRELVIDVRKKQGEDVPIDDIQDSIDFFMKTKHALMKEDKEILALLTLYVVSMIRQLVSGNGDVQSKGFDRAFEFLEATDLGTNPTKFIKEIINE